ncbi:uncharacterized protein MYCFIDRAFT_179060 [Pseudocercospora fijiensis CIRAD86]|uniref:BTB domain-containing protein n=1 Tax=Pseudocercospora fijiensis (strain CIRAD86) TaxID=383855 RepID=M2ZZF4_PSEFD|nr:uncharacterized protein MYCFIDRAFT_179060 [Pseudocercospora fijiensis CIRAD86]EME77546.1 hypothetical protein MYCFIDRAFT_179060 [Pseudocercospora fijiensis CIRAD86]
MQLHSDFDGSAREPLFTIRVGADVEGVEEAVFRVHRGCLTSFSNWFRVRLKEEWSKNREKDVCKLPDQHPDGFSLFVEWLYTGHTTIVEQTDHRFALQEWMSLAHAYVLGEALIQDEFQEDILQHMKAKASKEREGKPYLSETILELITIIYEGTTSSSPGRRFLVDLFRGKWDGQRDKRWAVDLLKSFEDKAPTEFSTELAIATMESVPDTSGSWFFFKTKKQKTPTADNNSA